MTKELIIPTAEARDNGVEIVRLWLTPDGNTKVSLIGKMIQEENAPEFWGFVAANLINHVVAAIKNVQGVDRSGELMLAVNKHLSEQLEFKGQLYRQKDGN